jgi:hypothetical protein
MMNGHVLTINGSRLFFWHVNEGRRVIDLADVLNGAKVGNIMNRHDGRRVVDLANVLHRKNDGNISWNKHVLIFI